MTWEDVRERFPEQWLVVEAIKAHSEAIRLEHVLPFVSASISIGSKTVDMPRALLDTGSGGTLASRLLT
jgi:hypothetical protein